MVNWQHSEPSQPTARPATGAVGSTDTEPRDIGSSNVPIAASYATGTSLPVRVWSDLKPDKFVDNIWVRLGKFPSVTRTVVGGFMRPFAATTVARTTPVGGHVAVAHAECPR